MNNIRVIYIEEILFYINFVISIFEETFSLMFSANIDDFILHVLTLKSTHKKNHLLLFNLNWLLKCWSINI